MLKKKIKRKRIFFEQKIVFSIKNKARKKVLDIQPTKNNTFA